MSGAATWSGTTTAAQPARLMELLLESVFLVGGAFRISQALYVERMQLHR